MEQSNHQEIAQLAYRLWQDRGSPIGSPEEDWLRAEAELRQKDPMDDMQIFAVAVEPAER